MERNSVFIFAGWSAYLSGAASLITLIVAIISPLIGKPASVIGDFTEILWFAFVIPIAIAFHKQLRRSVRLLSLIVFIVGIIGLLYSTAITFLINYGPTGFGDNGVFLTATIGFWFLAAGLLLLFYKLQPSGLSLLGIFIGLSYMAGLLGLFLKDSLITIFGIYILLVGFLYPI